MYSKQGWQILPVENGVLPKTASQDRLGTGVMSRVKNFWTWFLRGLPFGLANLLPGISGGTVALVLGYYTDLVGAIRRLQLRLLVPWALGTAASIFAGSWTVLGLLKTFPEPVYGALVGFLLASAYMVLRQSAWRGLPWTSFLWLLAGAATAVWLAGEPALAAARPSLLWIVLIGMGASATMLVPGVSGAAFFVLFGYYENVLEAVSQFDVAFLIPLAGGMILGLLLLAGVMEWLLQRHAQITYLFLTGLIAGSVRMVLPQPSAVALLAVAAGLFLSLRLETVKL